MTNFLAIEKPYVGIKKLRGKFDRFFPYHGIKRSKKFDDKFSEIQNTKFR